MPGFLHHCPPVAGGGSASTAGGTDSSRSTLEASLCRDSRDATTADILAKRLLQHISKPRSVAPSRPVAKLYQNPVQKIRSAAQTSGDDPPVPQ